MTDPGFADDWIASLDARELREQVLTTVDRWGELAGWDASETVYVRGILLAGDDDSLRTWLLEMVTP